MKDNKNGAAPPQKDRDLAAHHLRTLHSATETGDIVTSVHWLKKTLEKHGQSFESLAAHPEHLLEDPHAKLKAYADANRQFADREKTLLAENEALRNAMSFRVSFRRAAARTGEKLGQVKDALVKPFWIAAGCTGGPLAVAAYFTLNREAWRKADGDDVSVMLAVSSIATFVLALAVTIADRGFANVSHENKISAASVTLANTCKSDYCAVAFDETQGFADKTFIYAWLSNRYAGGHLAVGKTREYTPVVNEDGFHVGDNVCVTPTVYTLSSDDLQNTRGNITTAELYVASAVKTKQEATCTFVPLPKTQVKDVYNNKTIETFVQDKQYIPLMNNNGGLAGWNACTRASDFVIAGRTHAGETMKPSWTPAKTAGKTEWSCTYKPLEMQ